MAGVINDELIEYLSVLAELELPEQEKEMIKEDLTGMLGYIDKLKELDTCGAEPMSHVFPVYNVFREDVVLHGDNQENTMKNAPEQKGGAFQVPKTVE